MMQIRLSLFVVTTLLFFPLFLHARCRVEIKNQKDFDRINDMIIKAFEENSGEIEIIFTPGTYFYSNNHIHLNNFQYPKLKLKIKGRGAKLISGGVTYYNGADIKGRFNTNNAIIKKEGTLLPIWGPVKYAEGIVEVLDEATKECRIKSVDDPNLNEQEARFVRIRIPHWYRVSNYKVIKIENGYIYFVANDLNLGYYKGWSINDDYNYGRTPTVRYSLCNVEMNKSCFRIKKGKVQLPYGIEQVHVCTERRFMTMKNCEFKEISISDFEITGNSWYMNYLIEFDRVNTQCLQIARCSFNCIESDVIAFTAAPNAIVSNCTFTNCSRGCVHSNIDSPNTIVTHCQFDKVGLAFENSKIIRCQGANYHISNNVFKDYGYCAIFVGYGKTRNESQRVSGITEFNTLLYSENYIKKYIDYMLMDGGAIYVMTQNDKAVIRYNYISGYTGMIDNRGIFCDDGAYNVDIYGNVVTNISNSYCIDSRRAASIEKSGKRGANVTRTNVNNRIFDNLVDGRIRFEARDDSNGCELGLNYFLLIEKDDFIDTVITNLSTKNKIIVINLYGRKGETIIVNKVNYEILKKNKSWHYIKRWISCDYLDNRYH